LIHCAAGLSRSPTFAIAFLMKENKWHFEKAFEFMKSKKTTINPNFGFKNQLKLYEEELFNPHDLKYS
jgi:protein-tyrosine phosphatase